MDADRWRALSPFFDFALDLSGSDRAAWLERLRQDDASAADEIAAMLREAEALERDGYLDQGAACFPPGFHDGSSANDARSAAADLAGRTFGAYTLERLVGHGGMGSVWLAHRSDGRYEGKVAVKLLNAALISNATEARFRREGEVLARLAHPHITRLFDAGVGPGGQPYLVLEIVEGDRIDAWCDSQRLGIEPRLRLFLDVLAAVEHAHAHLIVHRDIKPENILVTNEGEVKLLDFGIAKLLEVETARATQLTRDGGRLMTPEYAAPEQLTGQPVTTATDVYSLGVLLYTLLTGLHPLGDATRPPAELVRAVVTSPAARLSTAARTLSRVDQTAIADRRRLTPERLRQRLRGDLDSLVAKALEKDPADRYVSVAAFAEDIRRHLAEQPVSARPDSFRYRAAKFVWRNRFTVALASLAAAATLAGLVGTILQAQRAIAQRDFALHELSRAAALDDFNGFLLYGIAPAGKPFTSGELLSRAERVVLRAAPDELRTDMLVALGGQYLTMDDDADARRLLLEAYRVSGKAEKPVAHARAGCNLSKALAREDGHRDESQRVFDEAMATLPDEPQFLFDRIDCLLTGSDAARAIGESHLGIERAEAAQQLIAKLPFPSKSIELRAALELAESYRVGGDFANADEAFGRAYERLQALGRDGTQQAGTLLNNWGVGLLQMGQSLRAEAMLRKAIDISRDDDAGTGVSPMLLTNYARVLSDLGRSDDAAHYVDRAYAEAKREDNELVMNMALVLQVTVRRNRGDLDGAQRALDQAVARLQMTLPPSHFFFAAATSERALLAAARHDDTGAMTLANRAVEMAARSTGNALVLPTMLGRRAKLELDQGHPVDAEADATKALAIEQQLIASGQSSGMLGLTYLALARAEAANGERQEAQRSAATAFAQLLPTLGPDHPDTRLAERLAASGSPPVR